VSAEVPVYGNGEPVPVDDETLGGGDCTGAATTIGTLLFNINISSSLLLIVFCMLIKKSSN